MEDLAALCLMKAEESLTSAVKSLSIEDWQILIERYLSTPETQLPLI